MVTRHTFYFDSSCRNRVFDDQSQTWKEYETAMDGWERERFYSAIHIFGALLSNAFIHLVLFGCLLPVSPLLLPRTMELHITSNKVTKVCRKSVDLLIY